MRLDQTTNGFPNGEPAIGPSELGKLMGWSRKKAWRKLENKEIQSLVVDVSARGIERRTCQTWIHEYMRSLNGRDEV